MCCKLCAFILSIRNILWLILMLRVGNNVGIVWGAYGVSACVFFIKYDFARLFSIHPCIWPAMGKGTIHWEKYLPVFHVSMLGSTNSTCWYTNVSGCMGLWQTYVVPTKREFNNIFEQLIMIQACAHGASIKGNSSKHYIPPNVPRKLHGDRCIFFPDTFKAIK